MKIIVLVFSIVAIVSGFGTSVFAAKDDSDLPRSRAIRVAPAAPVFSDSERQSELALRRKKVADSLADKSMLIMFSAESKIYTNDVDYHYRQENNLYYLTALKQNGITFVMTKDGGSVREFLFLPKRNPQFETWNGRMYSNDDARRISGLKAILDAREQKQFLAAVGGRKVFSSKDGAFNLSFVPKNIYLLTGNKREFRKENEFSMEIDKELAKSPEAYSVRNALPNFARLRLEKSPYEIKLIQHAIDITGEGIGRSMGMVNRANWEYEVHAEMEYTFRRRNADFWGFPSIVGCGPNATTLHYVESQGKVTKGDLMLMDVGAEYDHYTADVTRTFPVNGKFSKEQADIYQIVYDAQEAAAATLKPGSTVSAASRAAAGVIERGLARLGLIVEPGATFEMSFRGQTIQRPQYTLWFMHGWGHWLGMNVHDVGNYGTQLKPGMIMTNEPGVYVRGDALDYLPDTPGNREFLEKVKPVYQKYKNIGVRIEDDMLITQSGVKWMSKDIPRSIADIEMFMKRASKEMKNYAVDWKSRSPRFSEREFGNFTPYAKAYLSYRASNFYPSGQTRKISFGMIAE